MMELGFENKNGEWIPYQTYRRSFLLTGQSGTGKTQVLLERALTDIYDRKNITVIGDDLPEQILKHTPRDRVKDVVYFNPAIQPLAFNPLSGASRERFYALSDAIVRTVHTLLTYEGSTPVMDDYIRLTTLTLMNISTISNNLLSLYYFLTDDEFRAQRLLSLYDPQLKKYWKRFNSQSNKEKRDEVKSTLTKLSPFVFNPMLRDCLIQKENHLDFQNKIVLVSLNDLAMGQSSASFIGALVLATLSSNEDLSTTLYVDDANRFGSQIMGEILRLNNVHTMLSSRSPRDFKDYNEIFKSADLVALRCSPKDRDILDDIFPIGPQDIQLDKQTVFQPLEGDATFHFSACILKGSRPVRLQFKRYKYPEPHRNTSRNARRRKPVEQSIIDRCREEYTVPKRDLDKLLSNLLEAESD